MQTRIAELETGKGITVTDSSADPAPVQSEAFPAQALQLRSDEMQNLKKLPTIQFKGLTFTPGGFLEGTMEATAVKPAPAEILDCALVREIDCPRRGNHHLACD